MPKKKANEWEGDVLAKHLTLENEWNMTDIDISDFH